MAKARLSLFAVLMSAAQDTCVNQGKKEKQPYRFSVHLISTFKPKQP